VVQDCLERAWTTQHLWRDRGEIRPWMFAILHNAYANAARSYHRSPRTVPIEGSPEQGVNGGQ
jgi:RNA polymerase sigma-70 factor (ECF subfamily)